MGKQKKHDFLRKDVNLVEKAELITIELIQEKNMPIQFCPEFLVLYGLRGETTVISGKKRYEIERSGILTIIPFTPYSVHCAPESEVALLHISQEMLQMIDIDHQLLHVSCYTADDSSGAHSEYDHIRMYFARIFKLYFQDTVQSRIQLFTETSQLLSILSAYFMSQDASNALQKDAAFFDRYDRIMTYVHEHWREDLSVEQLAQQEYISTGYLSRSFKTYTGVTFTEYIMELRLQNAARDLTGAKDNVTKIAYENGFKNVNSFIKRFKERYGTTPKQYRKAAQKTSQAIWRTESDLSKDDSISALMKYATIDEQFVAMPPPPTEIRCANLCTGIAGRPLRHTWRRLLNVGYARNVLLAVVQNQIQQAQEEIGFEYIRFHGILDEDMRVYYEDEKGHPFTDFSRVDLLLDFALSSGLKPYIEFSYMPKLLAKNVQGTFDRAIYISAFNDERKWRFLINGLLYHCIERYGRSQVAEWKFTTIGSNCVSTGVVSMAEYLYLYQVTYQCVKDVDQRFAFGGPGGHSSSIWDNRCIHDFFEYVVQNHCVPDFVCVECFPYRAIAQDSDFWGFMLSQEEAPSVLSGDIHYTRTMLKDYRKLLDSYGLSYLGIWIEEWNSAMWQRDLSGDTCYKAAWLTNNLCENYDEAEAFGYWTLSDFIEERSDFRTVYHGGYGLFTYNGIPKSGWGAMRLFRMLGDTKLGSGNGWLVTKNSHGIQILLCHYCHYDSLYRLRYQMLTDPQQAYHVFEKHGTLKFDIHLKDLPAGKYEIRRFLISPEYGSSFDKWLSMGMPQYLRKEETDYLKKVTQPQYQVELLEIEGNYTFESRLEPHEVQIILFDML